MSLSTKVEKRFRQYLLQQGVDAALIAAAGTEEPIEAGQHIYTGQNTGVKQVPCVIVSCDTGTETVEYTGNYAFTVSIDGLVNSLENEDNPEPQEAIETLQDAISNALHNTAIKSDLNGILNEQDEQELWFFGVHGRSEMPITQEDCRGVRFQLRVVCCETYLG